MKYVEGKHQCHRIAFSDFYNFVLFRENNDIAEIMVHLIHRKWVHLLHNTVLILCDEGDGLVAVRSGSAVCLCPIKTTLGLYGLKYGNLCLFGLMFYVPVYSYGHVEIVSSPNYNFSWAGLTKQSTRSS